MLAGVALHALGDVTPHGELNDIRFEVGSAVVGIAALSARYGMRSPIVWGAIGAVLPDLEHMLPPRMKPRRDLFPTHRFEWLHSSDGALAIPAWLQVLAGGAVIGAFVARRPTAPEPAPSGWRALLRRHRRP